MAQTMSHDDLIKAFELRYDFLSARNVLAEVMASAGVEEKQAYEKADLAKVADKLEAEYPGTGRIVEALTSFGEEPIKPAPPAPAAHDKKEDKKEDKKSDKKEDKKKKK